MDVNQWTVKLTESFQNVLNGVIEFVPQLVIALVVILVGWLVAIAVEKIIEQVVKYIKLDRVLTSAGLDKLVSKGGFKLNSGKFLGELTKWFVIVVFLITAFDILKLHQVNEFLTSVVIRYIPQVIAAVLILILSVVIAEALQSAVVASAKTAGLTSAIFLGAVTKWTIWVFAVMAALSQLGIGTAFIQILFTGVVATVSIGLGLSLGLGGKEVAARALEKVADELTNKK